MQCNPIIEQLQKAFLYQSYSSTQHTTHSERTRDIPAEGGIGTERASNRIAHRRAGPSMAMQYNNSTPKRKATNTSHGRTRKEDHRMIRRRIRHFPPYLTTRKRARQPTNGHPPQTDPTLFLHLPAVVKPVMKPNALQREKSENKLGRPYPHRQRSRERKK